ncbi:MAG TPA: glycoside hydrolase family 3 C-terminal domain-containing protein, partial [Anaerolineales bacterium]|nr:glycoside hydrolase family 3 C-terminal domain-containing protein [Anaerolineales bacterium]
EDPELQPERAENKLQHRKIMREVAREAIVLLKNDGILPLKKVKSIAVIGPYAASAQILGGGSSNVTPHYAVSPLEGIRNRAGEKIKVETAPGCFIHKTLPPPAPETLSTADGQRGLRLSLYNGTELAGDLAYESVTPRVQYGWFESTVPGVDQESFSLRLEGFFTPRESGVHTLALGAVGWAKLYFDEKLLIDHSADADMAKQLTKDVKLEGGKAYPIRIEYYWKGNPRWRSLSFGHQPPHAKDLVAEAVKLAKQSDVVVLLASLNAEWESEGFDRADMKLPGAQNELIERIVKANKNTIVVLNTGSPVEMPWIDKVPAVLQLWYNGQEQGNALADILFGDVNPSGKLPTTFPVRLQDNAAYVNYPGENGKVRYGEGIFVGYRYYDKKEVAPLFPFGHGLSYTTFQYENLRLSATSLTPNELLKVRVDVTNTGKVTGKEVVQLYVRDIHSTMARPDKELKAFTKVDLAPRQTKTITFTLDREAFWYFDVTRNAWATEPGEFDILVGGSSRDIRLTERFTLLPEPRLARLHTGLTVEKLLDDPDGRAILSKHVGGFLLMADMSMAKDMTLEQVATNHPTFLPPALLMKIGEELANVS